MKKRPRPKQRLMTRDEFDQFATDGNLILYVGAPYDVIPCHCQDVNCHGWRFVAVRPELQRAPLEHEY